MRDRREHPTDDAPRETDSGGENTSRTLSVSNRETPTGLALSDNGTNYAELFTRLQKLIDNATGTIRDLRRENAELSGRMSQMDAYIQLRSEAVSNEVELHEAAGRLEEMLEFEAVAPAETHPTPTPLHRVHETAPVPAPEPRYDAPTNGYTPVREMPREAPPAPPVSVAPPPPPAPPVQRAPVVMPVVPLSDESETWQAPRAAATVPLHRPVQADQAAPVVVPTAIQRNVEPLMRDDEAETREAVAFAPQVVISAPLAPPVAAAVAPAPEPPPIPMPMVAPVAPVAPVMVVRRAPVAPVAPLAPMANGVSERYAGTYTLVVYPFTRFSDLGQFQSALQELVGIHDVQVRRFAQGTLEMRLSYDGASALPQALRGLPIRVEDVEEEEPYRLRVRLDLNSGS